MCVIHDATFDDLIRKARRTSQNAEKLTSNLKLDICRYGILSIKRILIIHIFLDTV